MRRAARQRSSADPNGPVTTAEFDAALTALNITPPFAVAVSGGADSLALLLLTAEWAKRKKLAPPRAYTVDHGLRAESALEAARVASWAKAHDVPHTTLTWEGKKPASNIQALARDARYRLLGDQMRADGIKILLTGHTRDDQVETFLLRLARGSGLDGLSGAAPLAPFPLPEHADRLIARPLLGFSHERLKATLATRKQEWLEDPSNDSERFARVQIRKLMPALELAGFTRDRIAQAADHLRRARGAIEIAVMELINDVEISPWGFALLKPARFAAAPEEVALRAFAKLIESIGGGAYPPRFEQTRKALAWVVGSKDQLSGVTLGGCRLQSRRDGEVLLAREEGGLVRDNPRLKLRRGESGIWDRRFAVTLSQAPARQVFEVRYLGLAGLKQISKKTPLMAVEQNRIAATTPAVWRDDRVVAAPAVDFHARDMAVSLAFLGSAAKERVKTP